MHHPVWLFATLLAASWYGLRLRKRIGYVSEPLMTWPSALVLSFAFVGASLGVAYGNLSIQRDAGVALYAVLLFVLSWIGLRYWLTGAVWDIFAAFLALLITVDHFAETSYQSGGLTLITVSLGASVGGYYATKAWFRILFAVLCAYDVYAVWLSDTMRIIMQTHPSRLPENPFVLSFIDALEIGSMDIILAAVAVVGIQRHRGIVRSFLFLVGCTYSVVALGALIEYGVFAAHVPYVMILAPLVFLCLSKTATTRQSAESAC